MVAQAPLSSFDPDVLHDRIVQLGIDWADKDAAASLLEETRKSILAKLVNESFGKSMAERESHALADGSYVDHIRSMVKARHVALEAKVKYDSARSWIEMARSLESTRRAEMGMR